MRDAGLEEDFQRLPPAGENPSLELVFKFRDVVAACARGDHVEAIRELAYWDRWLVRQNSLDTWFEVRFATDRGASFGRSAGTGSVLAAPLEEKARAAHDWLTLRRLKLLRDGAIAPSPIAALASLSSGPFAAVSRGATAVPTGAVEAPASEGGGCQSRFACRCRPRCRGDGGRTRNLLPGSVRDDGTTFVHRRSAARFRG